MSDDIQDNLSNGDHWLRALLIVLFAVVFCVASWVLAFVVGLNVIILLVSGRGNANLIDFGQQVGHYLRQIIDYGTLASDVQPFPFSAWPDDDDEAPSAPPPQTAADPKPSQDKSEESGPAPAGSKKTTAKKAASKKKKSSARKKTAKKKVSKKSG